MKIYVTAVLILSLVFLGCTECCAYVEQRKASYDPELKEHVLHYIKEGESQSVCIEEEFDLAEGEIKDFSLIKRPGGISVVLVTESQRQYILNLNSEGELILHRID